MNINTDPKLIEEFLTRGVEAIYPHADELKKKLMSGERLRAYQGFDPTGPYLHVGHAMGIRAMRLLQQMGHEVIFLVGDFTAMIGDPDKDTTRDMLTEEQIQKNMSGWKEQAGQLINFDGENPVQFKRNSEWLKDIKLPEVLKLMYNTTLQRTMERDLFARRLKIEDPIRLHEILYPLMQGYDGVAMNVDIEIGGADQTFNMLTGRMLSKAYLNKEKFVRANRMMNAPDSITMSKTKGNGINLSDSPEDMYGKAMSYADNEIINGFEFLTEIPMAEIKEMEKEIKNGANPMEFKKKMAFEIVKIIKGVEAAQIGQTYFEKVIQSKNRPEDILELKPSSYNVVDVLVESKICKSKSEARQMIEQGGVKVNDEKVSAFDFATKSGDVVQKGSRFFVRVK
ncbi:MAG TPA: tyrosine--tRNA ligase [Candidatus Magasanikbacteria bacterium]|nr:tyrosine--tRNA ligase [Candidatus Magasanikbacteria bacterium]